MKKSNIIEYKFLGFISLLVLSLLPLQVNAAAKPFELNDTQVIILPDGYPVIWENAKKYSINFDYDINQVVKCNASFSTGFFCSARKKSLNVPISFSSFRDYKKSQFVTVTVFYDVSGKILGTSEFERTAAANNANSSNASYEVGSLPGSFSVSPAGSATYSLAIDVPPGIAGLTPSIGVAYDSQGGNGLLGMGWSIIGLSQITRCAKTLAEDGVIHGVDFTADDAFCLDGQRLVNTGGNIYRPKLGNSIYAVYANNAFKVYGKGGSITEYGVSANSNIKAQGRSVTRVWAVNKVSDNFKSSYRYTYQVDSVNGAYRIAAINYAANTASINFVYENRLDTINGYQAGSVYKTLKRLKSIVVKHTNNAQPISTYKFTYHNDSKSYNPSHLVSLQKCNGTNCLKPTQFNWDSRKQGFDLPKKAIDSTNASGKVVYSYEGRAEAIVDVTGDGMADRVWVPNKSNEVWVAKATGTGFAKAERWLAARAGGVSNVSWYYLRETYVDVDADGLADRVWVPDDKEEIWVAKSTGSSFAKPERWISYMEGGRRVISTKAWHESYQDMNGDGRADRIWMPTGYNEIWVALSNGSDFIAPKRWMSNVKAGVNLNSLDGKYIHYSDVNGDGMIDRVWRPKPGEWWVALSTGTYFKQPEIWLSQVNSPVTIYSAHGTNGRTVDVNADGLADMVWMPDGSVDIWVALSTGKSFADPKLWLKNNTGGVNAYSWRSQQDEYYDVNADGLIDKVWMPDGVNDIWVALSDGTKFSTPRKFLTKTGDYLHSLYGLRKYFGDIDGDGSVDRVWMSASVTTYYYSSTSKAMTERITSIEDAMGIVRNIQYKPLTDSSIYKKGTTAKYPDQDIQYPQYVVSEQSTTDGLDGESRITYQYEGARVNLHGRGQLGFAKTTSTNTQTNLVTTVDYFQNYPFTGMVKKESQNLNGKLLISVTRNTPNFFPLANNRKLVYLNYNYQYSYDIYGRLISLVDTKSETANNPNGDITKTTVTTSDPTTGLGYTTVSENEYLYQSNRNFNLQSLVTKNTVYKTSPAGISSPKVIKNYKYNLQTYKLLSETGSVNGLTGIKKAYAYTDGFGHINTTTITAPDIETRIAKTEYDLKGQFATNIINEMGHSVSTTYDPVLGVPLTKTDANGLVTRYQYDSWGQLTDVYAPSGTTGGNTTHTEQSWCQINCIIPAINPNVTAQLVKFISTTSVAGGSSLVKYAPDVVVYFDKLGREIRKQTSNFKGETVLVDTAYDDLGRIVAQTQPYFSGFVDKNETVTEYDTLNRVVKSTTPGEGVTTVTYNALAFEVTTKQVAYNPQTSTYETQTKREKKNVIGQILFNTDNDGNVLYYEYDVQGNRIKTLMPSVSADGLNVVNPKGTVVAIQYDVFGRKKRMIDPNMGSWSYTYDSTSKLRSQTDAQGKKTIMNYDRLGRMVNRTDADGKKTYWVYNDDIVRGNAPKAKAIGKLDTVYQVSASGVEAYRQNINYTTDLGLVNTSTTIIEEGSATQSKKVPYVTQSNYDQFHRPEIVSYPQTSVNRRLQLKYVYTNGALTEVNNISGSISYWKAKEVNARGQITLADYGVSQARPNGVISQSRGHDIAGRLTFLDYSSGLSTLYNSSYQYSDQGSLVYRKTLRNNTVNYLTEKYYYDSLQRLTRVNINNNANAQLYTYDVLGNIRNKTGQGAYQYSNGKPHAVSRVNGSNYLYNNNGAITSGGGRSVIWSAFNKPAKISNATGYSAFNYGPSRARYKQLSRTYATASTAQKDSTTIYVGGSYEKVTENGKIKHKHYIKVAGKTIAQYTVTQNNSTDVGVNKLEYLLRDNQGSTVAVIGATGGVIAQMDYDAFGSRRPILGTNIITSVIQNIPRGYTGHEHLTKLGLIHMNGRVYDPKLGRFLSADPIIQFSKNIQSYNRFSYVLNNPMSYTDPSGFSLRKLLRKAAKVVGATALIGVGRALNIAVMYSKPVKRFFLKYQWARVGLQIGAAVYGLAGGAALASAYLTDISGGSFGDVAKAAAIAFATAKAFQAVGDGFADYQSYVAKANGLPSSMVKLSYLGKAMKVLAHGAVGWISSRASGGSGKGGLIGAALSQGVSQFGGYGLLGVAPDAHVAVQAAAAAIVGGVVSKAAGGSFEGGAISALYGLMFNEILHGSKHSLSKGADPASDGEVINAAVGSRQRVLDSCNSSCYDIQSKTNGPISSIDANSLNQTDADITGMLKILGIVTSKSIYKWPGRFISTGGSAYLKTNAIRNYKGDVIITTFGIGDKGLYLDQVVVRKK